MNTEKLETVPAHTTVDVTADGRVLLLHYDDELDYTALFFTPVLAAKLGQRLIDIAQKIEPQ